MADPKRTDLKVVDENYNGPEVSKAMAAGLIKEGRRRADVAAQAAIATSLQSLHTKLDARPSHEEERKHVKAGEWRGIAKGMVGGVLLMILAYAAMLFVTATHDHQMVVTGAAIGASNPTVIQNCEPGERMPDGHTCGLPGQ